MAAQAEDPTDAFFAEQPQPEDGVDFREHLKQFVAGQLEALDSDRRPRKVVLVTSGGTSVPLERNTVRFLDNFSVGTRGAASAEEFLRSGYAVVFLHRKGSLTPFARRFVQAFQPDSPADGLLKHIRAPSESESGSEGPNGGLQLDPPEDFRQSLLRAVRESREVAAEGRLLQWTFTSLTQYLFYLRWACEALRPLEARAAVYLAAAVSDFYVPAADLQQHKIQSGDGPLVLQLAQTPKCLGLLRSYWCPAAFRVSFKLETDPEILVAKARKSIESYGMHVVIANELHSRYRQVQLVDADAIQIIDQRGDEEIELPLIQAIAVRHLRFAEEAARSPQ